MNDNIKDMEFAKRLVRLRLDLPLRDNKPVPIKTVADESGVNIGGLSKAENGIVPGEKILNRLAKYYGVSIDYLLTGKTDASTNEPPPKPHGVAHFYGVAKAPAAQTQSQPTPKPDQESPFLQPMSMLSEILASGDPILVPAIQANLRAFQSAVRDKQRLSIQSAEIKELRDKCDEFEKKNANLEDRLAALEQKLKEPPPAKDTKKEEEVVDGEWVAAAGPS
ncbi:MAG: helix-turn-helix transcriptional regulator [Thermodesulfobacteriota bacterium]|nr:helix-turn-helix transcriptional regulator [Thermodesulfobacteriota bacterium]